MIKEDILSGDRLILRIELEKLIGCKRSKIYYMGVFGLPRPIRINKRAVRWRLTDVTRWIEQRGA